MKTSTTTAQENKPKLIVAGASAFALKIDFERLAKIAKAMGAYLMVDVAHYAGLIAAGVYLNPVPHADFVTTTIRFRRPVDVFESFEGEIEARFRCISTKVAYVTPRRPIRDYRSQRLTATQWSR